MSLRLFRLSGTLRSICQVRHMSDSQQPGWGSGAGSGGGSGGSIREAGGAFGKMEAFNEEDYFRKQQAAQLATLKEHLHDEIAYHEKEIKEHLDDLQRHKEKLEKLKALHSEEKK